MDPQQGVVVLDSIVRGKQGAVSPFSLNTKLKLTVNVLLLSLLTSQFGGVLVL